MTHPVVPSRRTVWIGRVLSAIPVAMMLFSASMKFSASPEALQFAATHLGWPETYLPRLALLEISCVVIYAIPQTAVLGAILISGYLGGAVATHFRVGEVPAVQCLLIALAWGGLYLRDPRLRDLLPRVNPLRHL